MKNIFIIILSAVIILAIILCMNAVFKKNKTTKIAFLGDSITEIGWTEESGYVRKVLQSLNLNGMHIEPIPAGVSGDSTLDMRQRLDRDVLDKKPDVVFFMGGINDIWFHLCSLDESKNNINVITEKILQSGAKPVIISLTLITEDVNTQENKKIEEFNKYLKEYTTQKKVQYIDANTVFKNELKKYNNPTDILTVDGVHLNERGNQLLADIIVTEFLKTYKH